MKKSIKWLILVLALGVVCCKKSDGVTGCWKEDDGSGSFSPYPSKGCLGGANQTTIMLPAGETVNLDSLVKYIEDSLVGVPGYQIAIAYDNATVKLKSAGFARTPQQCHPMTMGNCNKCNIASVTKMLTATLTLRLLNNRLLDEKNMIGNFLPSGWNTSAATDSITFQMLLSHTSGLFSENTDFYNTLSYNGIKSCLENGVIDSLRGRQNYLNVNYALLRIIIPKLWQGLGSCPPELQALTDINEEAANTYYAQAMQQLILNPAGVFGASFNDKPEDERMLYYDASIPDGDEGIDPGDWTTICGGGGLYASAEDLVRFMQRLFNYQYFSSLIVGKMQSQFMGFWEQPNAEDGVALGHGGDVGDANPVGLGYHSKLLHFKSGVSIAVNINSDLAYSTNNSLTRVIVDAYNRARN